jgi:hydrophobe/amphiphile efflux-1 (HAE1) family protein
MNLASLSIKRPTFIFALLCAMIIVGLILMTRMNMRMFPDVEFPYVVVTIQYPGAGPEEIENRVTNRVENAVSAVSGIKHLNSISQDGYSTTYMEFELSKDPNEALQDVKDKIAEIRRGFPDDIEEPTIQKLDPESMPIMMLSLKAELEPKELYDFADEYFRKELLRVDGVSRIWMVGGLRREIQVSVDRKKLAEFETTLSDVSNAVAQNSQNVPVGRISIGADDISFRSMGEYRDVDDIKQVIVNFHGNDVPVTVGDVAQVYDTTMERFTKGRINTKLANGKVETAQSLLFRIFKQSKSNEVNISNGILKKVEELNARYKGTRGNPRLTVVADNAEPIKANIADVRSTIFEGIFLAVVVVYFFLGSWRSTFITALALPNSLIGSFIFMYVFGFSINVISLMSLSLAVGLLIDDAIVVRENIFRHYEEGATPEESAQRGTDEVALAVIAVTSTVIAVFFPVAFLSGVVGQFFREFGLTVVFAMLISLADALTIAPLLSAYMIPAKVANPKEPNKLVKAFSNVVHLLTITWFEKIYSLTLAVYERMIKFIINNKIKVLIITFIVFAVSLTLFKKIPVDFMPAGENGEFIISIETAPGASLAKTDDTCAEIEKIIMQMPEIDFSVVSIGNNNRELNIADIYVRLSEAKKRALSTDQVKVKVRKALEFMRSEETIISVNDVSGFSGQKPFQLLLFGRDTKQLSKIASELVIQFRAIPGLVDISTNFRSGKPEMQIDLNPQKLKMLGVNSVTAGEELRAMVEGNLPAVFRANGLEYDIRVRFQDGQRTIMDAFKDLYVKNINGRLIKLSRVSDIVEAEGPTKIYRRNRARFINITANLEKGTTLGMVQAEVHKIINAHRHNPKHKEIWKTLTYEYGGNIEEMQEMTVSLIFAAILSIIFIYMVLASLYESVITPFTIMTALPLAAVGGLLALYIFKGSLDMFTMIGFIMLLGIVAKNSIILVDYIQQLLQRGYTMHDAVVTAGKVRLRPILMTSFALAAGMLPTALALTEVGKFRQGMGIVIIGGVVSSTILTLLVIPAIFEYMETLRKFLRRITGRPEKRKIDLSQEKEYKENQ